MQDNTENAGQISETQALVNAADSLIPDAVQLSQQEVLNAYKSRIRLARDTCQSIATDIAADYRAAIEECRKLCLSTHANCEGCYRSVIREFASRINSIDGKCRGQVRDAINYAISNTSQYLQSLGVNQPNGEQIQAAYNAGLLRNNPELLLPETDVPAVPSNASGIQSGTGNAAANGTELPTLTNQPVGNDTPITGFQPGGGIFPIGVGPVLPSCPEGSHFTGYYSSDGSPECLPDSPGGGPAACPPGTIGIPPNCLPIRPPPPPPPPTCCPPAKPDTSGGLCICGPERHWWAIKCLSGDAYHLQTWTGAAEPEQWPPLGYDRWGEGTFVKPTTPEELATLCNSEQCPPGFHWEFDKAPGGAGGKCVPDPPPPPPSPPTGDLSHGGVTWCDIGDDGGIKPPTFGTIPGHDDSTSGGVIGTLAGGLYGAIAGWFAGGPVGAVVGLGLGAASSATNVVGTTISGAFTWIIDAVSELMNGILPCNDEEFRRAVSAQVATGFFHKFGLIPEVVYAKIEYQQNYYCQYLIPGQGELNSAYIRGFINKDQWEDGTKMHGFCLPWMERVRNSEYTYPGIQESIQSYRREYIDKDTFYDYMQTNGVYDDTFSDRFYDLTNRFESVDQSINWTTHAADDAENADTLGRDDGFDSWYELNGKLLSKIEGLNRDQAQKQWRMINRLPSIGEAMEMSRRIKDNVDIDGTARTATPITPDELDALLDTAGYQTVWADRMAALTYVPVSIRHIRLLYETGQDDQAEVIKRYEKIGYHPDDADKLGKALVITTEEAKSRYQGQMSSAEVLKLFREFALSEEEAFGLLHDAGIQTKSIQSLLDAHKVLRESQWRKSQLGALKRRYLMGDYDQSEVLSKLVDIGISDKYTSNILAKWSLELQLEHKLPAANTLCDWYGKRLISVDEYMRRMDNLHFSREDAVKFVQSCNFELTKKIAAGQLKAAKEAAAAAEKRRKEEEKRAKELSPCRPAAKPPCTVETTRRRVRVRKIVPPTQPATSESLTETETLP